jgi:tripartite-type tricarboxylate transporter receptor subunit TctC
LHLAWLAAVASRNRFHRATSALSFRAGPATPPDIIPRVVANQVSEAEGWHFVIENKPGAIQTLAGSEVLRCQGDGA